MVATRIGPGQRTTAAPTLRQPRMRMARLGSSSLPKRVTTLMMATISTTPASMTTNMPIARGTPSVWKYGNRVKLRQNVAPAIVNPDPSTTCAVPWNIV